MLKKCIICQKEFEAKRNTKVYCSPKCRKLAFKNDNNVISVPEISVPSENKVIVPEKVCAGCGVKVHPLVCICADCLKEGKTHESLGLTCHKIEEVKKKD